MKFFTTTKLSAHQDLTPEGFLLARDIRIARCGTQYYRDVELPDVIANGDGWISVDREPTEVFNEDSIASFTGKPITNDHPYTVVTPDNWHTLAIGVVQNVRKGAGADHDCLVADLLFTTQRGIDLIRSGKRALSVGYDAVYEQTQPGRAKQRQIVANHVALVDEGRCGPRCTIVDHAPWYNVDYADPPTLPKRGPPVRQYLGAAPPPILFGVRRQVGDFADIDYPWTRDDYDPNEPRVPSGEKGGQWTSTGGGGGKQSRLDPDPHRDPMSWPHDETMKEPDTGPILVYRIGSKAGGLAGRDAGNLQAVAHHYVNISDFDTPASTGGAPDTLSAYEIDLPKDLGEYQRLNAHTGGAGSTKIGRSAGKRGGYHHVVYSFPKGYEGERRLLAVPLTEVNAELKKAGFNNADEAGGIETMKAMHAVIITHQFAEYSKKLEAREAAKKNAKPGEPEDAPDEQSVKDEGDDLRSESEAGHDMDRSWALRFMGGALRYAVRGSKYAVSRIRKDGKTVAAGAAEFKPDGHTAEILLLGSIQKGAGSKVFEHLLNRVKARKTIDTVTLNAAPKAESLYKRFGFKTLKLDEFGWPQMELKLGMAGTGDAGVDWSEWHEDEPLIGKLSVGDYFWGDAFDPSEPRNPEGEWTTGGGGTAKAATHAPVMGSPPPDREGTKAYRDWVAQGMANEAARNPLAHVEDRLYPLRVAGAKVAERYANTPQENASGLMAEAILSAWTMTTNGMHAISVGANGKPDAAAFLAARGWREGKATEGELMYVGSMAKGKGRAVVTNVLRQAKEAGIKKITATAFNEALGFYRKLGFKEIDPPDPENDTTHIEMVLANHDLGKIGDAAPDVGDDECWLVTTKEWLAGPRKRTADDYDPNEPRVPSGERAGQWTSGGGGGGAPKTFKAPKKTVKAYKLFEKRGDKLYPLFIGAKAPVPVGEWIEGRFQPTKGYAERPGWHAGVLPIAPHLRQRSTGKMAPTRVWAEVEMPADVDYQPEADKSGSRDIRGKVPAGGFYRFKTNKMQGGAWMIGGAVKVNRVLSNAEVASTLRAHGYGDDEIAREQRPEGTSDDWNESEHPRGQPENKGEFATAPGGGGHGIPGLPPGKLSRALREFKKRDAFEMTAAKGSYGQGRYEVVVKAKPVPGIKTIGEGTRMYQYDPAYAHEEVLYPEDPIISRTIATPNEGLPTELPVQKDPTKMYRGMSSEEYEEYLKTGEFKSKSEYNMSNQQGLTYWSTDPDQAESYANGFAPVQFRPTFEKPAYVVVAKKADESDTVHAKGTGENELGIKRAVKADEVAEVWRGRVVVFNAGEYGVSDLGDDTFEDGSAMPVGAEVVWEKVGPGDADAGGGVSFVSPSVADHMDFAQAVAGLKSKRQQILQAASADIDRSLGLRSTDMGAVGAWSDGAENSIMTTIHGGTFEELLVAAAMKASIAEQKAALVFKEDEAGESWLFSFPAKGNLNDIHKNLLADGVAFHTIIPTSSGATVYVVDMEGDTKHAVAQAAQRYGATVDSERGHSKLIGTGKQDGTDAEQRADAVAEYGRRIAGSGVPGAQALWERIHSAYGQKLHLEQDSWHADIDYAWSEDAEAPWDPSEHPRGQPKNAGEFVKGAGVTSSPKSVLPSKGSKIARETKAERVKAAKEAANVARRAANVARIRAMPAKEPFAISTRITSEPERRDSGDDPHTHAQSLVDWATVEKPEAMGWLKNVTDLLVGRKQYTPKPGTPRHAYVGMPPGPEDESPHAAAERFIKFAQGNLMAIYDAIPTSWRTRASHWYDGANVVAERWGQDYGFSTPQMAGVLAALSPKKDWFQNVDIAKRMLDYDRASKNPETDKAFTDKAAAALYKLGDQQTDIQQTALFYYMADKAFKNTDGSWKKLSQLSDPVERAAWMNMYDVAEGEGHYQRLTPEGQFIPGYITNKPKKGKGGTVIPGTEATRTWSTIDNVAKAVRIMQNGSVENISRNTGEAHKVRNFYMNIMYPGSDDGYVTIDTHAIAAAFLQPFGLDDEEVVVGLGNASPKSDTLGLGGAYPIIAEAYRRAALEISKRGTKVLPRQVQSMVWEGIQGLFSPEFKRDNAKKAAIAAIWHDHMTKKLTAAAARKKIMELASPELKGVPRAPEWFHA